MPIIRHKKTDLISGSVFFYVYLEPIYKVNYLFTLVMKTISYNKNLLGFPEFKIIVFDLISIH